ncbi:Xaa-Pro peptidase family protein [Grimontia hollisae]|uniref:M24 family metallopeptidase n=1 Tax=Grimontia hollisae TaxID=673 RepID=UPI0023DC3D94|nr:Xaa-Pro peptidase family protein [Grimontia hollisae]MDF2183980.1 Xaa-Pro peptidase family protein [Grimontia hollisae]
MSISTAELMTRTENLRKRMKQEGYDALIIYSDEYRPGHSTYVTNYKPINVIEESPQLVLLVGDKEPVVFLGRLNAYAAQDFCWIEDVRGIHQPKTDFPQVFEPLVGKSSKIALIGKNILPFEIYEQLVDAVPDAKIENRDDIVLDLRKIKTKDEIALMERAAEINDAVLKRAAKEVKVGMTEIQVAGLAEGLAREMNADIGSATVVMSGPNTNYPAWRATDRKIQPGEFVMLDFNPAVGHYCNDGGITILMPGAHPDQEKALVAGHRALKKVIPTIRPGITAKSIFDTLLAEIEPHGLAENFTPYAKGLRGVGHAVGIDVVEAPNLSSDSDFLLEAGMTLAVKLDLHDLPGGGYRIEVVVAVTEDGVHPLNKLVLTEADDFAIQR